MGYTDLDWKAINTIRLLAVCLPHHHQHCPYNIDFVEL